MEFAGYDKEFRYKTVKMAIDRHRVRLSRGGSMYEDKKTRAERANDGSWKKRNWYKGDGKYNSVMFVQP